MMGGRDFFRMRSAVPENLAKFAKMVMVKREQRNSRQSPSQKANEATQRLFKLLDEGKALFI